MEMISVSSSNLSSIGYDQDSATLRIQFNHGGLYEYYGVPQEVFDGLLSAGSVGRYFDQFVRKGGYGYSKV